MLPNVLDHEPHSALFVPDSDPLLFYRAVSEVATTCLKPGGMLFFEINEREGEAVTALLSNSGFSDVELRTDINGKQRMVFGLKSK